MFRLNKNFTENVIETVALFLEKPYELYLTYNGQNRKVNLFLLTVKTFFFVLCIKTMNLCKTLNLLNSINFLFH